MVTDSSGNKALHAAKSCLLCIRRVHLIETFVWKRMSTKTWVTNIDVDRIMKSVKLCPIHCAAACKPLLEAGGVYRTDSPPAAAGLPFHEPCSAGLARATSCRLPTRSRDEEAPRLLPSVAACRGGRAVDDDPLEVFGLMPDRRVMQQRSLGTRTAEAARLGGPQAARLRLENLTIFRGDGSRPSIQRLCKLERLPSCGGILPLKLESDRSRYLKFLREPKNSVGGKRRAAETRIADIKIPQVL
uniref:Uncharacterized protein n=1 Tax=Oryza glumipatula TaxID=40148 RepID=A0A0D9YBD4_9ORYZ